MRGREELCYRTLRVLSGAVLHGTAGQKHSSSASPCHSAAYEGAVVRSLYLIKYGQTSAVNRILGIDVLRIAT